MVRIRIYINRELQSEGMTVHMSADCVSHDNVIAVFQTALFPAGELVSMFPFRSSHCLTVCCQQHKHTH